MSEIVLELPPFLGETPSAPTGPAEIDHASAAVERLIQQFRKPRMIAFVRALCAPMAALERAFFDILAARVIETSSGDALRQLASLVGQPVLAGLSDVDLRRYVRARILANRSCGLGEDLLAITRLVVNDENTSIQASTARGGTAYIRLENNPTNFDIGTILFRDFLARAVAVGVQVVLEWWPEDESGMFEFETFVPGQGAGLGWGSTLDAGVGGAMASATSNT